jgi:IS605 OrfB family transposase
MLTYRYRVKDATTGKQLQRMAWAVNRVWNFANETSLLAWRREKRFVSAFELINLCAGAGHELGLHTDTISEVCTEYVKKRKQFHKIRLRWRSKKRSLGWIPFKGRALKLGLGTVVLKGKRFRVWQSRPVEGIVKTGSFAQDACGHWYINLQCEVALPAPSTSTAELGIDLGLKDLIACSDGVKYSRENLTRTYEDALAMAQRAHKKRRVTAIHAKIAHCRKDWAHKTSTTIAKRASLIAVGNVSVSKLVKTRMAKSVLDAGWSMLRTMLAYKALRLGITYSEVNESWSSVTCADCGTRCGPHGLSQLGVRKWCCSACGMCHDRDTNAARNILATLRMGRHTPAGIPLL